jgi:hypothetical protein
MFNARNQSYALTRMCCVNLGESEDTMEDKIDIFRTKSCKVSAENCCGYKKFKNNKNALECMNVSLL